MAHRLTTCTFCGVGCGLYLETSGNQVVGVYPSMSHPANAGRICVRGWHAHEVASSPDRLRRPLIKKNGRLEEVDWGEALAFVVERLEAVRDRYGPDALAFYCSPRCSNEEAYLLQKLARVVVGTNNVDHGAGVYCNNSIDVLLDMLGVPATTSSIDDLSRSDVIVVDGTDLAKQLPTIAGRVIRAKAGGAKLIVVGKRRHRVAEQADFVLQLKPGTEALLYGAMAKVIVDRGLVDAAFIKARCQGYEALQRGVEEYDLLATAEACGVPAEQIEAAALAYGRARAASILYSTADEVKGTDTIEGIVNLALLTGNVGKEGAGVFALTEHNNLQGVCDVGMVPERLPGYRAVADAAARAQLERTWGKAPPADAGLPASAALAHRGHGRVRGLWLCRYDPVSTAMVGAAASSVAECDLVVVQHIFLTETARRADVVLPTTAFGEERVTFTSTERRIQLAEKVIEPPPGVTPAWQQLTEAARGLGADWRYASSGDVMDEIAEVVPFYGGATHDNLARDYGRQWPCTKDRPLGTPRLLTAAGDRRFRFAPVARPAAAAAPDAAYPFTLVFGHSNYYWNQNVLIQHSETLKREYRQLLLDYPDGFVEVNTADARQLGVRDGERICLRAAGGSALAAARITSEVRTGTVFVPFFVHQVQRQIRGADEHAAALVPVRVEKESA
jgi:predicted molibdopterin-dependent oxidoreductase YjgC